MLTPKDGQGPLLRLEKILLFGLLLAASLISFSLVRDNTFWHSGDFLYLEQAIDISSSWTQIFATTPDQPFQPLVKLFFYLEYSLFGLDAWKYYLLNVFVHSINALLVYFMVFTLLQDRAIAVWSSLLFALAVGNYGKAVMVVSGISDLLITLLTLSTLLCYFKNELTREGHTNSPWFFATIVCFVLSLMTKATSFSILGCMLAFNLFFRTGQKRILNRGFVIIAVTALVALVVRLIVNPRFAGQEDFTFSIFNFLRNFGSYLVRMVFPIHSSSLVADSGPVVRFIYDLATEIRVLTFLCILSFSVFGFIFGNRTVRFFITWTYITVMPFCFFRFPADWLNIRYLYLVSVGFIMILASVTVLASRLLYQRMWRRFIPYSLPLIFVFLSQFIIFQLDKNYEATANSPQIQSMKNKIVMKHMEDNRRN